MDGLGCLLASWFIGKEANDINALIRQCSSFRILSCSGEESKMLCKDIRAFVRASKLEELISVQEDGSEVKLYMQTVKNKVHQVFVSVVDEEQEVVFLQVKGKFDLAAIQKLAKTSQISIFATEKDNRYADIEVYFHRFADIFNVWLWWKEKTRRIPIFPELSTYI